MQFLHCAAHLPLIANYREPATWQASPICRLKRKLSPNFKGTVQLQSNNFYIVLRTLLYVQNMSGTSHTLARQSLTKLPLLCLSAQKKSSPKKSPDSSQTCRSHLSPHPGILPPQVAKQLLKMLSWICKIFISISHRSIYVQAFHIALTYIKLFRKWQRYPNLYKKYHR